MNHDIHAIIVGGELGHVHVGGDLRANRLGLLHSRHDNGGTLTDLHLNGFSHTTRSNTQSVGEHRARFHRMAETRHLRSDDQQAASLRIISQSLLRSLIKPILGRDDQSMILAPMIGAQISVGQHVADAALLQGFVERVEVVHLLLGDDRVETEGLVSGGQTVRILGETGRGFQEVTGEGHQHRGGFQTIVFTVGEQHHIATATQVAEINTLENRVHRLMHLGHGAHGAVTADRREEPLVTFDNHVTAEALDALHESRLGDELLIMRVTRMQIPCPHAGDEFRNVREAAGTDHVGGDGLHMVVQVLPGVNVEADEVKLLLQLGQVERAGETGGGTTGAERMRVVVEQGDLVEAAFAQHAGETIHGVDQIMFTVFRPVGVPGDALLIVAAKAARRLEVAEVFDPVETVSLSNSFDRTVLAEQELTVLLQGGVGEVTGIRVDAEEERHLVIDLAGDDAATIVDRMLGENLADRVIPERGLLEERVGRIGKGRDRLGHLVEDRAGATGVLGLETLIIEDALRITEPGHFGVDLRAGTDHDVQATILAKGEERVDVGTRIDLAEVEDATGNLVSLPRNVDGDHGETEVDDFVENLLPLVTVEAPVVDGTTVKFCTFAVHLDR